MQRLTTVIIILCMLFCCLKSWTQRNNCFCFRNFERKNYGIAKRTIQFAKYYIEREHFVGVYVGGDVTELKLLQNENKYDRGYR